MRTRRPPSLRILVTGLPVALLALQLAGRAAADPVHFQLPGTQPPGSGIPADAQILHLFVAPLAGSGVPSWSLPCANCHGTTALPRPLHPWQGSMMAQAARDPLFYAQLDLTLDDPTVRPIVNGMADMCLRCHSPVGWLEGRSTTLNGMGFIEKDLFGVQCHACHRMVDPKVSSGHPDYVHIVAPLTGAHGIPPTYGNGMYVMDRKHTRRGPYSRTQMSAGHASQVVHDTLNWTALTTSHSHPTFNSAFHRSGDLCGTCHDVSNPTDCLSGATGADTQKCFPIERTWSEWKNSGFSTLGEAGNCQSCHMSGPLNAAAVGPPCEAGNEHLNDIHVHDLTGGNTFIPKIIREMKVRYDTASSTLCSGASDVAACMLAENNFKAAVEGLYPPAGASPFTGVSIPALDDGIQRARRTLRRAAFLDVLSVSPSLTVKVTNRTGHKLPTGYPEGRRMWLNVRFVNATGGLLAESGRYETGTGRLYHDQDLDGAAGALSYDVVKYTDAAGTALTLGRPTKVWEARVEHQATHTEFHFALNDALLMDNRIPPRDWSYSGFQMNRALPLVPTVYTTNGWQSDYGGASGPHVHWDQFDYALPSGTDRVELTLYYQTISHEYAEALKDDNPNTDPSNPAHLRAGGYNRGTLFHQAYVSAGRSAPETMRRLVKAVVDTDGDELSDGWETANSLTVGSDDYNGDPDGDGRSNYQEFQAGSDPQAANAPTRTPVDVVLVLDVSGSMGSAAPGSSTSKIDVLKDVVSLFLETWSEYAIADRPGVTGDRIGVVYFGSEATQYGTGAVLKSFAGEWENIKTAVQAKTHGGWTAMGAGLYTAFQAFPDPTRRRHVILFSNGMQNYSPMVVPDAFGDLVLRPQTSAVNPDVVGASAVHATLGGSDYVFPSGVRIHTVGIGVAERSGPAAWHKLLFDLSRQPGREGKHNFITRAFELEGVFLEDLVESLKTNTLQYVLEEDRTLAANGEEVFEIPVNPTASRFSLVLSWSGRSSAPPQVELLRPDGASEDLRHLLRTGPFFHVLTRYVDEPDVRPEDYGLWKLRVKASQQRSGDEAAAQDLPLRLHAILDETEVRHIFSVPGRRYRVGEPLRVTASAGQGEQLLKVMDEVTVTLKRPGVSVQDALARSRHQDVRLDDQDLGATPFNRKAMAAFSDPEWVQKLTVVTHSFSLVDDGTRGDEQSGDGVFSAELMTPTVPGHYELHLRMVGHTASGARFERQETRSITVQIGPLDDARSGIERIQVQGQDYALLTPRDAAGNMLGPGYTSQILVRAGDVFLPVEDLLDGSYRVALTPGLAEDRPVEMIFDGERFHDAPVVARGLIARIPWWLWWLLLLVVIVLLVVARRRS